jgi:hypothetical protein
MTATSLIIAEAKNPALHFSHKNKQYKLTEQTYASNKTHICQTLGPHHCLYDESLALLSDATAATESLISGTSLHEKFHIQH